MCPGTFFMLMPTSRSLPFPQTEECRRRRRGCAICGEIALHPRLAHRSRCGKHQLQSHRWWSKAAVWLALLSSPSASTATSTTTTTTTTSDDDAALNPLRTGDFCQRSFIKVSLLSVLCDTPGAYYSGSTAYRNSVVCEAGDKANLHVACTFVDCAVIFFVLSEWCSNCHCCVCSHTLSVYSSPPFFAPQFGYHLV